MTFLLLETLLRLGSASADQPSAVRHRQQSVRSLSEASEADLGAGTVAGRARIRFVSENLHGDLRADERGAVPVSVILAVAALVLIVYALLGAGAGEPEEHGRVAVPSVSRIVLPAEEVDIFYGERTGADGAVSAPADLRILITDPEGQLVGSDARGGRQTEVAGVVYRPVAAVRPPVEATYTVSVESTQAAGRPQPTVAFGQSPVGAVGERLSRAGDLITSPWGYAAGALLLFAFFWPSFQRALQRRRRHGRP